jgi:hypothetical protein
MAQAFDTAKSLTRACGEVFDSFNAAPPPEVFHYTDTVGLIGILQNRGELWATDVRCMNDTRELTLGYCLLKAAIDERSNHQAYAILSPLMSHPAYKAGIVFATSFSEERDLLSQWRAYADNGMGFAVGFLSDRLSDLRLDGKNPLHKLMRVEYDLDTQKRRAGQLVDQALESLTVMITKVLDHQDEQLLTVALGLILPTFAATCKNVGFAEEKEYRIVLRSHQDPILPPGVGPRLTAPQCRFRAGRYGITPYVKLRFPEGVLTQAISRIVIGPRAVTHDTEQKVRMLLANAGVKNWSEFPIDRAVATYR